MSKRILFGIILFSLPAAAIILFSGCNGDGGTPVGGCGTSGFYCPAGFVCNPETGECDCDGTAESCFEGSVCDVETGQCICATDDCCPDGYRFDLDSLACVCASDSCCPDDYKYDSGAEICVCAIDMCCPPGFKKEDDRCLCEGDTSCEEGFYCDRDTGDCRCLTDDSCGDEAFCNDFGFCQQRAACTSSFDCPTGQVCNTAEGFCMSGYCTIDADCPMGRICRNNACHRGCRTSDDCWLAQACISDNCRGAICDRDSQCGFGERCTSNGTCETVSGPYCNSCTTSCPGNAHCVTWMVEGSPESFCAVDCTEDRWCPNGYSCGGTYYTCDPTLEMMLNTCGEHGLQCVNVTIHNEPDITHMCGRNNQPEPVLYTCGPIAGSCDEKPPAGQTTRPGPGAACNTMCRDGLVCANVGNGYRCYADCSNTGSCSGSFQCRPADNGVDMVCAPQ